MRRILGGGRRIVLLAADIILAAAFHGKDRSFGNVGKMDCLCRESRSSTPGTCAFERGATASYYTKSAGGLACLTAKTVGCRRHGSIDDTCLTRLDGTRAICSGHPGTPTA